MATSPQARGGILVSSCVQQGGYTHWLDGWKNSKDEKHVEVPDSRSKKNKFKRMDLEEEIFFLRVSANEW